MALAYTNTKINLREISLKDRPAELYNSSKKGTVPVLITTDNLIIDESLDIMLWTLKNYPNQSWLSKKYSKEIEMITLNDTLFKKWLDRYKYYNRYPNHPKEYYRENCSIILNKYENRLNKTKYLLFDSINIVDIAIFPFIRQFANVDYKWFQKKFCNLAFWLENICNSTLFNSVMKKYSLWDSQDEHNIIKF